MGKFTFDISDDFVKQLGNLADVERIAPMMLNEATPILRDAIKRKVKSDYSTKGRKMYYVKKEGLFNDQYGYYNQTGSLFEGVKMSRSRKIKNGGFYANVYFTGYDKNGVSNAQKAIMLEYGTKHSNARPFMAKVVRSCENEVLDKMQEVFNREVDK